MSSCWCHLIAIWFRFLSFVLLKKVLIHTFKELLLLVILLQDFSLTVIVSSTLPLFRSSTYLIGIVPRFSRFIFCFCVNNLRKKTIINIKNFNITNIYNIRGHTFVTSTKKGKFYEKWPIDLLLESNLVR